MTVSGDSRSGLLVFLDLSNFPTVKSGFMVFLAAICLFLVCYTVFLRGGALSSTEPRKLPAIDTWWTVSIIISIGLFWDEDGKVFTLRLLRPYVVLCAI